LELVSVLLFQAFFAVSRVCHRSSLALKAMGMRAVLSSFPILCVMLVWNQRTDSRPLHLRLILFEVFSRLFFERHLIVSKPNKVGSSRHLLSGWQGTEIP
jgi:hypothetical protein